MYQESLQHCACYQSVVDDEPDVLIIKEERPDSMRCEQSERETETAENHKYAVLFLMFVCVCVYACVYFVIFNLFSCPPGWQNQCEDFKLIQISN